MDEEKCIFTNNLQISCKKELGNNLSKITHGGLLTIIKCSERRPDNLHLSLKIPDNASLKSFTPYKCHKACKSTYTSDDHIKRFLESSRERSDVETVARKIPLRSDIKSSKFIWKEHCLLCGEKCCVIRDPKHPDRWHEAYECHTSDRGKREPFKNCVLKVCDDRDDQWSDEVRTRLCDRRCSYDLHSADARYHDDCRKRFMNIKKPRLSFRQEEDLAFIKVLKILQGDTTAMWASIELDALYRKESGDRLSRSKLVQNVLMHFGNKMIKLSSNGLADSLIFREKASSIFQLQDDEFEVVETMEDRIKNVAEKIVKEIKEIPHDKGSYKKRINIDIAMEDISPTLSTLLSEISPNLQEMSLPAIMIGNIITSKVANRSTHLLIDPGLLVRKKKLIEHLYDFGIVCSYDEVKLFRSSAAMEGNKLSITSIMQDHEAGLIQAVADNFDCHISSPNGLKQTHSLAMLLTLPRNGVSPNVHGAIPRLKRSTPKHLRDVPVIQYHGQKKPEMPLHECQCRVHPLKILAHQVIIVQRSKDIDFRFFIEISSGIPTPEYSGFNTRLSREEGRSMLKATTSMYTPLIDLKPSDPTTMLTAMTEAQRLTEESGQQFTIFTCDQQLYKVLCDIKWAYPAKFANFIPCLGGMHFIMSFVGCVGVLMQNTGLEDIMKSAFSGVQKMLVGKNYPHNVRALRIVVEELLKGILNDLRCAEDLENKLSDSASKSKTSKLWIDGLIKPVFLMMLFIRAE